MPIVFVGMLIGGAVPWLFSSFAIMAVSRAASLIIREVRRQFKLGVLEGEVEPDYDRPIEVSTSAAQKELIPLALIGVLSPIIVGLVFQVEALGGFLAGIILSGQLLAVFLNNSGGAWDNAKKLIEDEPSDPEKNLGKGSERHKAGVVGDTVGDPRASDGMSGDAMRAIFTGFLTSAAISVVLFGIIAVFYMQPVPGGWWRPFLAATTGVLLAIGIDRLTDYFTGSHGKPVQDIKDSADSWCSRGTLRNLPLRARPWPASEQRRGLLRAIWCT